MTRELAIFGVDPGQTTGLCLVTTHPRVGAQLVRVAEVPTGRVRVTLLAWVEDVHPAVYDLVAAVERYTITRQTARKTPQHHALHVVGVVGGWASECEVEVVLQGPGDAKKLVTNRVLKKIGWHTELRRGGHLDHGADAVRQALRVLALRRASVFGDLVTSGRIDPKLS